MSPGKPEYKITIYDDELMKFSLELYNGQPFVHCTVYEWSKDIYKSIMIIWEEIINQLRAKDITALFALVDNNKLAKFSTLFGFEYTNVAFTTEDGPVSYLYYYKLENEDGN